MQALSELHTLLVSNLPSPDPIGLPLPHAWLQVLSVVLLLVHFVPLSFVMSGGWVMMVALLRGKRETATRIAHAMPVAMALTITSGVAPLLFLQVAYDQYFYTSSILMAWPWLLSILLMMLGYYGCYVTRAKVDEGGDGVWRYALAVALLFTATSLVFSANMTLMLHPEDFGRMYHESEHGLWLPPDMAGWLVRWCFVFVGTFAMSGLYLAWKEECRDFGVKLFRFALGGQALVGLGYLFVSNNALPEPQQGLLLGGSPVLAGVLGLAGLLGAAAIWRIATHTTQALILWVLATGASLVVRNGIRNAMLAEPMEATEFAQNAQWGAFVAFVVIAGIGAWVITWLVKQALRKSEGPVASQI